MKIYLAAKYSKNPEMRIFRDYLESKGFKIISRWINGNHELIDIKLDKEYIRFAEEDYEDLINSNLCIWFSEEPNSPGRNRGGRHVEFGIALALNIPIFVIGRKENVFHWMPQVQHFSTLEEAIKNLKVI